MKIAVIGSFRQEKGSRVAFSRTCPLNNSPFGVVVPTQWDSNHHGPESVKICWVASENNVICE